MRRQFKILLWVACVLLPTLTTPAVTQDHGARSGFNSPAFVLERREAAPQTTSRKRRSARSRRRARAPQSSKPATATTQSQATTQPPSTSTTSQGPLSQVTYQLPL